MKKVLHLIGHLKPGGAETLVKDYALHLDKNKFKVIIVTIERHYNTVYEKILMENNIKLIFLGDITPNSHTKTTVQRGLDKLKRLSLLKEVIKNEKPDIIHTHLVTNDYISFINTSKIKLYHTIHSEVSVAFRKENFFHKFITAFCIKYKNMTLITINKKMYKDAINLFKTDNCIILHNGVNIEKFKYTENSMTKIKKDFNIPADNFIVGHVGRFEEVKNHKFLIKIFRKIQKIQPNSILILIGDGNKQDEIKEMVHTYGLEENILFIGTTNRIPELMKIMDTFVLPSKYEGFGLVLIEAQAANIKCVISDTIPKEVEQTNLITSLSLDARIDDWCEEIMKPKPEAIVDYGLGRFDIKYIVKELEQIYLSN